LCDVTIAALSSPSRRRRQSLVVAIASVAALSACGGGSDDAADGATSTTVAAAAVVTTAPVITSPPTTTTPPLPALVTEGATIIVANASHIDGSAGRMTEQLASVGYAMGTAGNSTEGQLEETKIYYDASIPAAQEVALSVGNTLGGAVTVEQLPTPPPIDTGEMAGSGVLVALGKDKAGSTIAELNPALAASLGIGSADTATTDTTPDTTPDTTG
jgi:hypothetical protein